MASSAGASRLARLPRVVRSRPTASSVVLYLTLVTVATLADTTALAKTALPIEYCSPESFIARCEDGDVILMRSAKYGRMRSNRCIGSVSLGCNADVLHYLDQRCSGLSHCEVEVNDLEKYAAPCPKDYKAYLEAQFVCVKAQETVNCAPKGYTRLPSPSGYLVGTMVTGPGVPQVTHCEYALHAHQGQNITLHLFNFPGLRTGDRNSKADSSKSRQMCRDYSITIQDRSKRTEVINLCESAHRHRYSHVFTSHGSVTVVRIKMSEPGYDYGRFLLKYAAIGCATPRASKNLRITRAGDSITVQCNTTDERWQLTCDGLDWVGEYGNCSSQGHGQSMEEIFGANIPFQQGLALAIAVGVVVGTIVGSLLLVCIYTLRKGARETSMEQKQRVEVVQAPRSYVDEERSLYPALLAGHERATHDGTVYDYTHVWDSSTTHLDHVACPGAHQHGNAKDQTQVQPGHAHCVGAKLTLGKPCGTGPGPLHLGQIHRMHIYETAARDRRDERCKNGTDPPVYFEFDPDINKSDTDKSLTDIKPC